MGQFQITLTNINKSYGALKANDNVSLLVKCGSIHALLGENGAGKSTLVNILYGLVSPDSGEIKWQDKSISINSPMQARALGIGIVFQHFALFNGLSVLENIALGIDYRGNMSDFREEIIKVSEQYQLSIDPDVYVSQLSAGAKQRVEIVRCLLQKPKLLVLDEPTSVLTPVETQELFKTLKQLKKDGCAILFIGHKLDEIKSVCDEATVLRRGQLVGTCDLAKMDVAQIATMMVGDALKTCERRAQVKKPEKQLTLKQTNKDFGFFTESLTLKSGCILGVAGISGNGQDELMAFLAGELFGRADDIDYQGKNIGNWTVRERNQAGILFVPTERLGHCAVPQMSLFENALLGVSQVQNLVAHGLVKEKELQQFSENIIKDFDVKTSGSEALASSLSGGNLQKFIVGRTVMQHPKVLLIANPTWGVDIAAATFIRNRLLDLKDQGVAILMASEDLDEIFMVCDEIAVITQGELSQPKAIEETNLAEIGLMMTQ